MKVNADVIVVGGGYFGTAISSFLTENNINTILLEKDEPGYGASGGNFGCIQVQDAEPGISLELTLESFRLWQDWKEKLGTNLEYMEKGSLIIATSKKEWELLQILQQKKREQGLNPLLLSPEQVKRVEPVFPVEKITGASLNKEACLSPFKLINCLEKKIRSSGGRIYKNTTVTDFIFEGGRIKGVVTDKGEYYSNLVILATGAWTAGLCRKLGLDIPVDYVYAEAMVTEVIPKVLNNFISSASFFNETTDAQRKFEFRTSFVCTQTKRGNLLLGETSFPGGGLDPDEVKLQKNSPALGQGVYSHIKKLLPDLLNVKIIRSWRTVSPFTSEKKPVFGFVGPKGLFVAAGFKSAVIMMPVVGIIVSDLIKKGYSSYDLSDFSIV